MTDNFQLVNQTVKQAQDAIEETTRQISRQAREMADILETCRAGWTGAGAEGFKTAQVQLNQDHDEIRRLLDVLRNAVSQTKNLNSQNDYDVRASFAVINKSGLNNV
ncbi:WXG100 family type VII secretion target [Streptomyces sp. TRM49041]|uniref:WXG100 family type VII secretion target n=1 Tax=Streptomyces sp. TRM49041 TaxID=2603216 RepID=UPI0011EC473A|nr:WXG100 family type VII secretion target [Streptomyces sp. TRM49041]